MNNSKLLLVDDESLNLLLYSKMLKDFDFELFTANNGKECIEKAGEIKPNLILLDWNMPIMDGIEALEILKKTDELKEIPVIMITGVMSSPENLSLAMSLGASDFIRKPFDKLELTARVKNILLLYSSLNTLKEQYNWLENKNRFISSLIESIPHPVTYHSPDGTLIMYNKFFASQVNAENTDLTGKSVYPFFVVNEIGMHAQKDAEVIEHKSSTIYESHAFTPSKTFIVSKNVVTDAANNITGVITAYTEVSDLKKANEELVNAKKLELISSALQLIQVNEMNEALIGDLNKVLPFTNKEGRDLINKISQKSRVNLTDHVWSEFEKRFESTFDTFLDILLKQYPTLSPTERKLCALLRLGLSSKEIAVLTFQNSQSVDVARYRLRKKLNLNTDDNLNDFLIRIGIQT